MFCVVCLCFGLWFGWFSFFVQVGPIRFKQLLSSWYVEYNTVLDMNDNNLTKSKIIARHQFYKNSSIIINHQSSISYCSSSKFVEYTSKKDASRASRSDPTKI